VTAPVELFRKALLGAGTVSAGMVVYSVCSALAVLLLGVIIFNKVERTFMDSI
jgi:lipopolysaccharide transport system permease protein